MIEKSVKQINSERRILIRIMASNTKSLTFLNNTEFNENREYLNWPGLQYLWYTKLKPMVYDNMKDNKSKLDDENWYISYDYETGEVYLAVPEDNQNFAYDQDGSCGSIIDFNGMLQVVVDTKYSALDNGFIDDRVGCIGMNSDQIGDATGVLYCQFNRGSIKGAAIYTDIEGDTTVSRVDKLRQDLDNTI